MDENVLFSARDAADEPPSAGPRRIFKDAPLALAPCVDGDVCPTSVTEALASGVGADKPLLIGATAHEFTMMLLPQTQALAHADPRTLLEAAGASSDLAQASVEHAGTTGDLDRGPAWVLGQAVSNVIFRAPVAHWSHLRNEAAGGTWAYDFRWESRSPDVVGAAHCVDIPFGMDMLSAEGVEAALGPVPPQELADSVHGDWLALIRDSELAAPQHGRDRHTIVYGADGTRSLGTAYHLEARIWDETHSQS